MGGNRGTRTGQGGVTPASPVRLRAPSRPPARHCRGSPSCPARGWDGSGCPQPSGGGGRPQMGPPPDPLPALLAALFGTRSAGGSTVTGHIPSLWCCHGPPVSPPRCHQHLPGEPGGPVALVVPGDHLDRGHPAKGNLPVPKMILKDWFLPKKCIPAPPHTPSRPPPAFTWGPPSPLHPGGPGSRLLLPGGPWGTEGGQRAPRAPPEPPGTPTHTHHRSAGTWGSLLPPGTPGAFLPLGGGERKGFRVRVEGEGGSST